MTLLNRKGHPPSIDTHTHNERDAYAQAGNVSLNIHGEEKKKEREKKKRDGGRERDVHTLDIRELISGTRKLYSDLFFFLLQLPPYRIFKRLKIINWK